MTDFAKCHKRSATCYAPSRCADLCKVIPAELLPDPPAVVEDIEDDGDVTLYPRMGALD